MIFSDAQTPIGAANPTGSRLKKLNHEPHKKPFNFVYFGDSQASTTPVKLANNIF
jgi:hypothetical protein